MLPITNNANREVTDEKQYVIQKSGFVRGFEKCRSRSLEVYI